jgi:hypothetical protein
MSGSSGGSFLKVQPPALVQFILYGQHCHLAFKLLMKLKTEIKFFFLKVIPGFISTIENTLMRRTN